jgi:hypothetical protein
MELEELNPLSSNNIQPNNNENQVNQDRDKSGLSQVIKVATWVCVWQFAL